MYPLFLSSSICLIYPLSCKHIFHSFIQALLSYLPPFLLHSSLSTLPHSALLTLLSANRYWFAHPSSAFHPPYLPLVFTLSILNYFPPLLIILSLTLAVLPPCYFSPSLLRYSLSFLSSISPDLFFYLFTQTSSFHASLLPYAILSLSLPIHSSVYSYNFHTSDQLPLTPISLLPYSFTHSFIPHSFIPLLHSSFPTHQFSISHSSSCLFIFILSHHTTSPYFCFPSVLLSLSLIHPLNCLYLFSHTSTLPSLSPFPPPSPGRSLVLTKFKERYQCLVYLRLIKPAASLKNSHKEDSRKEDCRPSQLVFITGGGSRV